MATAGGPTYLFHLAMREPPFAAQADARFFYVDPARQQCLDMLLHLAEYSREWLLVSGPSGVGKSRLLEEFCNRTDPHLRVCCLDGKKAVDGAQLFTAISASFGVDLTRGDGNPLEILSHHLNALHKEQLPAVAVDDADRLTDDALEIILHLAALEGDHGKLVRVLLFAQAALQHRLAADRFKALSRPHLVEIQPFDEAHTAGYLVHRMSVAGYDGPNPFDAGVVRQIFRETRGLPGRINASADHFLTEMAAEAAGEGSVRRTPRVAAPAAALAVFALLVVLFREPLSAIFDAPTPADAPPPATPLTMQKLPLVASAPRGATPSATGDRTPTPGTSPAITTAPPPVAGAGEEPLSGTAWLEAQRPDHFTLQLLAASRRPTVRWFLETHPPAGPYAVVETTRNGAPLHVIVAGEYPTWSAALAAAHRLDGVEAWPRPFRELQSFHASATQAPAPGRN